MIFPCTWYDNPTTVICCNTPADYLIIQGCINQHLQETTYCVTHADAWYRNQVNNIPYGCISCDLYISDFIHIHVNRLTNYRPL